MTEERKRVLTDTVELLKYEISVDGRGVIEGGRVREAVQVGKKNLNVRKAYAPNGIYKVGWVYDFDVSYCMICMSEFGWFIRRHHCRACGYVVCGECSKYKAKIGGLPEEIESRICCNCYQGNEITPGGRFSPNSSFNASFDMDMAAKEVKQQKVVTDNIYSSPIENDLTRYQIKEQAQQKQAVEDFERSQARHYAHSYRVMRGIVPPDITSTDLSLMLRQGAAPSRSQACLDVRCPVVDMHAQRRHWEDPHRRSSQQIRDGGLGYSGDARYLEYFAEVVSGRPGHGSQGRVAQ